MPLLLFPNPDALRLALASGIVPADVARGPVRGAADDAGRPWVEVPAGFPRDAVAALARIGVSAHGPGVGPAVRDLVRWAELLPLRGDATPTLGPVLFAVPDRHAAKLAAALRRLRAHRVTVRLVPDADRALVFAPEPSLSSDLAPDAEAFAEAAPRVWVAVGWQHPLPDHLAAPDGSLVLVRPGRPWQVVPDDPPRPAADTLPLPQQSPRYVSTSADESRLPVRLTLKARHDPDALASVWVLDGDADGRLAELARDTDERELRRFRAAVVTPPGGTPRLVLRAGGRGASDVFLPHVRAFTVHPACPTLFLPAGHDLAPPLRPRALAAWLGLTPNELTLLEPDPRHGVAVSRVPSASFRPIADLVQYVAPPPARLDAPLPAAERFAFARFVVEADHAPPAEPPPAPAAEPPVADSEGWLARSIGKLTDKLFGGKPDAPRSRRTSARPPSDAQPAGRVREKLASRQALLHGNEWAARRAATEQRVLTDLPRLPPAERAVVWGELAEAYSGGNNPGDAAVCWLNAAWDAPDPPADVALHWLRAEATAALARKGRADLDALLRGPPTAASARLTAAYLAWAAAQPAAPAELPERLPHFLAALDRHESDLPARAAWLARHAAARLAGGDALALARCRDRLFRRLADHGPGLDLDAPSFLRFRGGAGGERFATAREWLVRVREPVHKWLARLVTPGKLQWAGIDPEAGCTTAYADLMIAWGLSRLGDRTRARDVEAQAVAVLDRAKPGGVDPAVHRVLRTAFRDRVRAAQDGRPDRPGLPLDAAAELPQLDDLGRYAVDRLRAASGILEPVDLVNPYRGRDLGAFLGTDALGERLARLLARPDLAPDPADVRGLLAAAKDDPTAVTLPRVAFALLEVAPRLDPAVVAELLPLAGTATELIPEWVRVGVPGADAAAATRRFGGRLLAAACHAAGLFHLPDSFRRATEALLASAAAPDATAVRVFGPVAGRFFRTLRKLGLTAEAAELLAQLRPGDPAIVSPHDLGLAVGWFAAGNEDAGNRVLNAARDHLFVRGVADVRERTALAIAYAAALGHAPPGIALGRLEELFLRLDGVTTTGATNRYYTLKPLELIDTVVRAVVSDDFALGPGVRGWLDDDEYLIRKRVTRDLERALAGG